MPYVLYDKGVKYYLTDHVSIYQMIDDEESKDNIQKWWPEGLRKQFPNDKELMAYLDLREKRLEEIHQKFESQHEKTFMDNLWEIKKNLEQRGGELYDYKILGKKGFMGDGSPGIEVVDEGWLILSKGKVFKKYVVSHDGIESKDWLEMQGIK